MTSRLDRTEKELEGLENTLEQYRKHLIDYGLELKNLIFLSMKKAKNKTNGKDRGQREETTDSAYQSIDPFVRIAYWFVIDIDIDRKIHIIVH